MKDRHFTAIKSFLYLTMVCAGFLVVGSNTDYIIKFYQYFSLNFVIRSFLSQSIPGIMSFYDTLCDYTFSGK